MTTLRSGQPVGASIVDSRSFSELSDAPTARPGCAVGFDGAGVLAAIAVAGKAAASPTSETCLVGDITWNSTPTTGQPIGWMCTVAGSAGVPGTWKSMGNLA